MTLADWIPAVSTSMITAVIGFAVGTYYKARVEKGVQHNLDRQLETLKAELHREEEAFKRDLRAKDDQIAAIRNTALAGLANRNVALTNRRLEAIERLWRAMFDLSPFKVAWRMTQPLNMDAVIDGAAASDSEAPKLKQFADGLWRVTGLDNAKKSEFPADHERPFVSPLAWALFQAYRSVLSLPAAQLAAARTGIGRNLLADDSSLLKMVKSALPHRTEVIEKYGMAAVSQLVEELEETLLAELT